MNIDSHEITTQSEILNDFEKEVLVFLANFYQFSLVSQSVDFETFVKQLANTPKDSNLKISSKRKKPKFEFRLPNQHASSGEISNLSTTSTTSTASNVSSVNSKTSKEESLVINAIREIKERERENNKLLFLTVFVDSSLRICLWLQ